MEVLLGDLAEPGLLAHPGACPQHVDRALFLLDRVEQTVQIVEVRRIALHAGHVPANQLDGFIHSLLPPTRNENVSSFVNEQLGTGQRHTARRAGDHRDLAIELSHDDSIHSIVPMLCTPICVLSVGTVVSIASYAHRSVPNWATLGV